MLRIWQSMSEFRTKNARRKRAHLLDLKNQQSQTLAPFSEVMPHTSNIGEDIQICEEIDFGLINNATDDINDEYETFQLRRK